MINMADEFIFYDDVQFTKNDWRNRNKIKTATGPQWITIPVRVESLSQRILDTKVSQLNWAEKHWKTLLSNYSRAPFFSLYRSLFEDFYSHPSVYISEINCSAIRMINAILGIKTKLSFSQNFKLINGKNERLIDLILQVQGDEYISGPSAKNYIDEEMFREAGITINWMDYSGYPEYNQLFSGFEHRVSIIDLLFNEGDKARNFMKSFERKTPSY